MNREKILDLTIKQVLKLTWKHKVGLMITLLSVIFILLGIFNDAFRERFLFDRYGKFQWIGVSAIFAGVGLLFNSILKKEEIRANILTKNDLELLKDFREKASEFSALIWKYNNVLNDVLNYSKQNRDFEINFNAELDEQEKTQHREYYSLKGKELNDMYFRIMELYTNIYFDLTISFDVAAENVNESLKEIKKLLDNTIEMNDKVQSLNDINMQYKKVIHANDKFTTYAQSYIVLVMENKVSSFDSKIIEDN